MAASDVRNIVIRAMFEAPFYEALTTTPEVALKGYNLSDDEKRVLESPSAELFRYLLPTESTSVTPLVQPGQAQFVVVAVIAVVAIVVFAVAFSHQQMADMGKFAPLISAIKSSSGQSRADLVTALISELLVET